MGICETYLSLNARKSLRRTYFDAAQVWTTGVFAVPPEVEVCRDASNSST